jgi:hypothetical protein
LEVEREEPIVASGDHVDRNIGPGFESAGLAEHDLGLGPLARRALPDRLGREVVEEVGGEVEVSAVATALCGRDPGCDRSRVVPPLPAVSPGTGIIALTNTSMRTGARAQTRGP